MSGTETLDPQFQADTMMSILSERLAVATPVEGLSSHNDRKLEVFEEADGCRFVKRSFTGEAVNYVERNGVTFREAWEGMEDIFGEVGIDVVPSFLLEQEGDEHPFVAVSEYLPEMIDVKDLPLEEKEKLVHGLGQLLRAEAAYWPSLEAVREDTFKGVVREDGTHQVLMVDTDPFTILAPSLGRDEYLGTYIKKFAELIWDEWCDEQDRSQVASALVQSLAQSLGEDELFDDIMSDAGKAFMNLHLMSNGVDSRESGLLS
jgi:hypothetical protein